MALDQLHFAVSQDEEHTCLSIAYGSGLCQLGERVHHYPLLVLARLKLEDTQRGLEPANQGWVDFPRLASMVGIDPAYLNIQIFRARRQIARALPGVGTIEIVERRRGQIRIGAFAIWIVRGSAVEAGPLDVA